VAFQACGPDRVYPAAHRGLARRIRAQGAVVSEFPPGSAPRREFFPLRNRLISGIARALIVVEARERSGSLVTAGHALDQGIDVFAVPGPIAAPTSRGTNRLIRDGACPLLELGDVLDALGWSAGRAPVRPGPAAAPGAIEAALLAEPATRDELARRLERSPEQLALELLELELDGRVVEDRDGRLRALRPGSPALR
jgi:DNA processing protein